MLEEARRDRHPNRGKQAGKQNDAKVKEGKQAGKQRQAFRNRQVCKQSLTLTCRQTWMKAAAGRQKLPGRARQMGWQWQGQRGRLADSPQAGTKQT
jgi:hypothetical protein